MSWLIFGPKCTSKKTKGVKLGAKQAISYPEGNKSTPFFFVRSSVYSLIMIVIVRRVRFDNKRIVSVDISYPF